MSSSAAYVGDDRRDLIESRSATGTWTVLLVLTLSMAAATAYMAADPGVDGAANGSIDLLWAAGTALALVASVAAYLYARVSGSALAWRVGSAAALLTICLPLEYAGIGRAFTLVASGLSATWVLIGLRGPQVDTRLGYGTAAAEVVTGVVLAAMGAVALTQMGAAMSPWPPLAVAGLWGVVLIETARRRRGPSLADWVVFAALGWVFWAISEVASEGPTSWVFAGELVRTWSLGATALGIALILARSAQDGRRRLHDTEIRYQHALRSEEERQRDARHELRNALLAIEGATVTLARLSDRLTPEVQEELRAAVDTGFSRLRHLVDAPEAGEVEPTCELHDVLTSLRATWFDAGAPIDLVVHGDVRARVRADSAAVLQILDNLVQNGIRHGGVGPERPLTVRAVVGRDTALIRVIDTGPGVPASVRPLLFDRAAGGVRLQGEGIGLAIARKTARDLGGDLALENGHRSGACFLLTLPLDGPARRERQEVADDLVDRA